MKEQKRENPGARAIASGVKIELADENQHLNISHTNATRAILFWDRSSNSVEHLALLGVSV